MEKKFVVTIARQFGSLGRPIARSISETLGVAYYDRDLVERTAQDLGLPVSTINKVEETTESRFFSMSEPLGSGASAVQDSIFAAQRHIILDLADAKSCIIVGRCSDYILNEHENVMNIFIYAPYQARLENCVNDLGMHVADARHMIAAVDKARESYHRRYCGYSMSDKDHKHLMIDSSMLGVDGTQDALTYIIRKRFELG